MWNKTIIRESASEYIKSIANQVIVYQFGEVLNIYESNALIKEDKYGI